MRLRFTFLIFITCFLLQKSAHAQDNLPSVGFMAGGAYSKINNVDKIIISELYFNNYTHNVKYVPGFTLGAFINYEIDDNRKWFGYGEVAYSGNASEFDFTNTKQFNYQMKFDYQYANILGLVGLNLGGDDLVFGGDKNPFHIAIGPQFGINMSPHNIKYKSFGAGKLEAFGTDVDTRNQLREVLVGKSNFGIVGEAGVAFSSFEIAFRYHYGLKNIVEVQPNSYNFVSQQNHNYVLELTCKWYLIDHRQGKN